MPSIDLGSVVGPKGDKGDTGPQGLQGIQGIQGPTGYGVIPGGSENSFMAKNSAADYDTKWMTLPQIGSELVKPDNPVGAALSGKASNPNLLDNWYFADPINQRGQTEYTGAGYTIDRFRQVDNFKVTIEDDGLLLFSDSAGGQWIGAILEASRLMEGMEYTFSVLTSSGLYTETYNLNFDGNYHGALKIDGDVFYHQYRYENGSVSFLLIKSWRGTPAQIKVKAVKLELGPVQTLAHKDASGNWVLNDPPPNKALELAKCQRYFQTFATESMRPIHGKDFRPVMRTDNPTLSTITLPDETVLYAASSDL